MVNVSTMNTIPLITNRMSKMKCQWRATPIVCRPPGIPNNGLSMIASSLAVHTRFLGIGPRNRSHSESGVQSIFWYSRGWSARICQPARRIITMRKKFSACVTMIHTGTPGGKLGVDCTHGCVLMNDWATLVV